MTCKFVIADQNAVSVEGHFQTYTHELACAAQALGCETVVLWNRRFPLENLRATYHMQGIFTSTEAEAAARNIIPYGEGHFGFELERALTPLALGARDHVVIHTCHYVELAEALDYLVLLAPIPDLPTFHIVVRYDPNVYRYRMSRLLRRLGAIQRTPYLREKLRLHSDTQQLATEFARLFSLPVGVCPIPVDLGGLLPAVRNAAELARGRPLIASYLGPARSEKGYRDILDAIDFLRKDYIETDRLHFVLQCSERSIQGEAGLADYQKKLEAYIREHRLEQKIRLVEHVVDQEEYCALVAQSDIVLMAYSPVSYRYRSSSVLMEAMATGKVIVTRQGSWMASRVGPDNAVCFAEPAGLGPALAEAVSYFDRLNAGAKARQSEAIEAGASATLARYFLGSGADSQETNSGSSILMIADGDELASGALGASLFLHHLSCYAQAGYRVHVMLRGSEALRDFVPRRRISDALRPYRLASLSILSRGDLAALEIRDRPQAIYLAEGIGKDIIVGLGLAETPLFTRMTPSELYPFPVSPSQLRQLAGPVNGFELIASCDPLDSELGIDNRPFIAIDNRYKMLVALESVDILLHATERGAARRFFDEVFTPFLAERAVTVLVIGEVGKEEYGGNFLRIGPVADRDPLYAAAKIVVTTEGRLAPVAISEALSKGKPTLVFGAPEGAYTEALEAHDDPARIAKAILGLLDSPDHRANEGQRALQKAHQLGVGKSGEGLAGAFSSLGVAAPFHNSKLAKHGVDRGEPVEWSAKVRAANQFVRDVLANEPLDRVGDLSKDGLEIGSRIAKALVDECDAPLLEVDGSLRMMALRRQARGGAAEIVNLLKAIIDMAGAGRDTRRSWRFVINQLFPTKIILASSPNAEMHAPQTLAQIVREWRGGESNRAVWRLRPSQDEDTELASFEIANIDNLRSVEVVQEIPLDRDATVFGRRIFANWSFDHGRLMIQETTLSGSVRFQLLESLQLRLQSLLSSWSPWASANPLFDAKWYLRTDPKVSATGLEAFRHYEKYGARKGYRPNPFFEAEWYANRYRTHSAIAWRHYLMRAQNPQQDPGALFSGSRYLARNPDVAANWPWGPLLHYTLLGRVEGRDVYPAEALRPHQSLALPVVIEHEGGELWLEFMLDAPAQTGVSPIALHAGDCKLEVQCSAEAGSLVVRARLRKDLTMGGLIHVNVTLERGEDPVEIRALRTGWIATR